MQSEVETLAGRLMSIANFLPLHEAELRTSVMKEHFLYISFDPNFCWKVIVHVIMLFIWLHND